MPDSPADSAISSPAFPDISGRTLGDFHVLRPIGTGGMGQVYLARQVSLKREVALKLLRGDLSQSSQALQRFQAEAEAIARISHPNIVQVYAIGEQDGLRYMALEYVDGRNLREFLARKGPPDLPIALAIIRQVAAALQRAGELGIVHRDIKPENILLTKKVEVKVTDFGLSRLTSPGLQPLNLTQSGVTLGTPLYMAPEQVRGQPTDHRSDIYSFGVTAYHLLAGDPPFTGANAIDVAMKHINEQPLPLNTIRPDIPADLCGLVHKMMAKKPEDRYQTAKEILRDVAKLREGLTLNLPQLTLPTSGTGVAVPTLPVDTPSRWPARVLAALAVMAAFAAGWFLFDRLHRTDTASDLPRLPGLPEERLPEGIHLISAKERELLAKLDKRGATPTDVIDASLELGMLYIRERRFTEAEKIFTQLEQEKPDRPRPLDTQFPAYLIAARFGQAIVKAQQDQTKESIALFRAAIDPLTKKPIALGRLQQFFAEHRELALAVAEALQRNADNLKGEKLPPTLERFRSPTTMLKD